MKTRPLALRVVTITALIAFARLVFGQDYPGAIWNPADANNYGVASRTATDIRWIVIHTTEDAPGSDCSVSQNWFKNPDQHGDGTPGASAHYVICRDGTVVQMVRDKDIAYHAGNSAYNQQAIGIEHERHDTSNWTEAQFQASVQLVKWLVSQYSIQGVFPAGIAPALPSNGSGIIGHNQVPDPTNPALGGGLNHKTDPVNWDWAHYQALFAGSGNVAVTVDTAPSGLSITVDNVGYTAPQTFYWSPASSHTLSTPTPQFSTDGHSRYRFSYWSDTGRQTHTVAPTATTTYTATFSSDYLLDVNASPPGAGTFTFAPDSPGSWYTPGQTVQITANEASGYALSSWIGADSSAGNTATVTMNSYQAVTANFTGNSVLALTMTASPNPVRPGEQVNYVMTVVNRGASDLSGVYLRQVMPAYMISIFACNFGDPWESVSGPDCSIDSGEVVTWNLGTVPAGRSRSVLFAARVKGGTGAPPNNTVIASSATVSASSGAGASASASVIADASPPLVLSMMGDRNPATPNDVLTYTLSYGNPGPASLPGVTLRARVPSGTTFVSANEGGVASGNEVVWDLGTLTGGAAGERAFSLRVNSGLANGTVIAGHAEVGGGEARADMATMVQTSPVLALAMTASPNPVRPGEQVNYVMTVVNRGASALSGVYLRQVMPTYMISISACNFGDPWESVSGPDCSIDSGEIVTWNLGALPAGQSRSVVFGATIKSGASAPPNNTVIVSSADVSASNGIGASASVSVIADASPALVLSIVPDRNPATSGEVLTYTVGYANPGGVSLPGVALRARVPSGTTFVSANEGGVASGNEVAWDLGSVAAGAEGQRTFSVTVNSGLANGTIIAGHAEIGGGEGRADTATVVQTSPVLALAMTASPDPVRPGEQINYVMTVVNRGVTDLSQVNLRQVMPAYMISISACNFGDPWESVSGPNCSIDPGEIVTWNLGTLLAGQSRSVVFAARVKSGTSAPPNNSVLASSATATASSGVGASASASVIADASPALVLSMVGDRNPMTPGEGLTYTLSYGNPSGVSVPGVTLRARVPSGTTLVSANQGGIASGTEVVWDLGTVAAGAVGQRTFSVTVNSGLANGTIIAGHAEVGGGEGRADTATVVQTSPVLALAMTASPDPVRPGEQVNYVMTVVNRGATALSGVYLREVMPAYMISISACNFGDPWDSFSGPDCSIDSGEIVTWSLGTLPAGQSRSVAFGAVMKTGTGAPPNNTLIVSSAEVSAGSGAGASASASFTAVANKTRIIGLSGDPAFGSVTVGNTRQATFTIANTGNATLTVSGISYPSGFTGAWSGTIPPSGSQPVTVSFAPTTATSYGGNLTISSDSTSGNNTLAVSGTGTPLPGALQVAIGPPGAITAGAQWQVDGGTWQNSGDTVSGLSVGNHTVHFNTISGWTSPVDQSAAISSGSTSTTTGTYTPVPGSLQVTISPAEAVNAGGQWQVDGGAWHNSGDTVSGLSVGNHTVHFNTVAGWTSPVDQSVAISSGSTSTTTGTYTPVPGSLQVTISPAAAVSAGAQWQVDGGAWQNSGATVSSLSAGNHTVHFNTIAGWISPADQSVAISNGSSFTATGTYTPVPTRIIALSGDLAFGNVTMGGTAQRTLTISNTGNATLTVSNISYPAGFSGDWSSGTIMADSSQAVTVTFAPTGATNYAGSVAVVSDATSGGNTLPVSGTGTLVRPPNDDFVNRIAVSGPLVSAIGQNTNASKETGEPNHAGVTGGKSVWWSWVAPASGTLTISTAGSSFDTVLGLYTGASVSNLVTIASNDDANPSVSTSLITVPVVAGTEYEIAVDGYGGAFGSVNLSISLEVPAPVIAVTMVENQVALSWGTNWTGYVLESAKSLGTGAAWDQVSPPPVEVGGMNVVTNSMSRPALFYRLRHL